MGEYVSFLGTSALGEQLSGFCEKKVSVFEGNSMYLLWDVCPVYVRVYKREGDPGGPQPSPGSSELLARPVPGHLGSARALWCAGEKWKC